MNPRLLSDQEKRANRKGRQQRNYRQRAARRRRQTLAALCDPCLAVIDAAVSARQCCDWQWSDDLRPVKRAIQRLNAAAVASDPRPATAVRMGPIAPRIERPVRILRNASRGEAPRFRAIPVALPLEYLGVDRALLAAKELVHAGAGQAEVLQFMTDPLACGLSLDVCAELAYTAGVLRSPVAADLLDTMNRAIAFQNFLADGRAVYRALLASGEITAAAGAWAYFTMEGLCQLLPGLRLPRRLRRDEYLVNVITGAAGEPVCLDLHGIRQTPICQHPLR